MKSFFLARYRKLTFVIVLVMVLLIAFIFVGYMFDWTGFSGGNQVTTSRIISGPSSGTETQTEVYRPGKTLWDWLSLLIVPLALASVALAFNQSNTRTEQNIALDKQREDLLQAYFDRMSELLLEKGL